MAPPQRRNSLFIRKGSIHCGPMKEVEIADQYDVIKSLGTGRFGHVQLAEHKESKIKIALKTFPKANVKQGDFIREYNFSFFLSPHQNIVDTYDGTFSTNDCFYFVQEYCPCASLREAIEAGGGIPEAALKIVLNQVFAALEFMHNENLVHRNLKAENILVFDKNFEKIKITDFGLTRKRDTTVKHIDTANAYHAPELCDTLMKEAYSVDFPVDTWAVGIIVFYALRGKFPWLKASIMAKPYWEWGEWLKRTAPQLPPKWGRFTEKGIKFFKKAFNPKPKDRATIKELKKLLKDKWMKDMKSMSEEDFGDISSEKMTTVSSPTRTSGAKGQSTRESRLQEREKPEPKPRSVLHQWFSSTMSTMSEISEQMVSATE